MSCTRCKVLSPFQDVGSIVRGCCGISKVVDLHKKETASCKTDLPVVRPNSVFLLPLWVALLVPPRGNRLNRLNWLCRSVLVAHRIRWRVLFRALLPSTI